MADIEELRRRVEAAQERFGLLDEQQQQYSGRLVGLMDAVDDGIRQQRAFADDLQGEVDKLAHENDELKTMLQALLLAVEHDSQHGLADTMQMLESRAGALVEATETAAALPAPDAGESTAAPETVATTEPEPSAPQSSVDEIVEDVPVTPPTPWDDETAAGAAAAEPEEEAASAAAEPAADVEADAGAPAEEVANPDVEERVKRLIEMTGGSSSGG